jgi:O-antigen/teichoic acid export membrane protein
MTLPNMESSPRSPFFRDVFTLVKGTTISLIIYVIAAPILTRLYGPEAFGLVSLFTSITSILGIAACLSYELAIILPKSDEEAANVFGLCMLSVVFFSFITIPLLFVLKEPLLLFLKAPHLGLFLWLIPPTLLVSGTFLALNYWNTRTNKFYRLSIARVIAQFSTTGTQLGVGYLGLASGGVLIGANILGQFVSTFILWLQIMRDDLFFFKQNITRKGMTEVFKRYSNFPKYEVPGSLINTLSWQIPIFMLSYFFSTTIVGYYSLGMMVVTYPMALIGSSISQVFFQKAAIAIHEGSLPIIFENTYTFLMKISMFPLLLLTFIGQDLFVFVFGPSWSEAGVYIQILSIWAVFYFIASPISSILSIKGRQKLGFWLSSLALITRFLSIYLGGILGSATLSILFFSLFGAVSYGFGGILFMHLAGVKVQKTVRIIFANLLVFLPAGIIMSMSKILKVNGIIEIILATILLLIYFVYLIKTDATIRDMVVNYRSIIKG